MPRAQACKRKSHPHKAIVNAAITRGKRARKHIHLGNMGEAICVVYTFNTTVFSTYICIADICTRVRIDLRLMAQLPPCERGYALQRTSLRRKNLGAALGRCA